MKDNYYVDNKKFLKEMINYVKLVEEAENSGEIKPQVSNYIGECILLICESLTYRWNFINYTWHDDMISDAIENCILYASNFNSNKSKNPFGYFTQIAFYAFLRRIDKEKKQSYIKYKLIENSGIMDVLVEYQDHDEDEYILDSYKEYLRSHASYNDYYEKEEIKKERRRNKRKSQRRTEKTNKTNKK